MYFLAKAMGHYTIDKYMLMLMISVVFVQCSWHSLNCSCDLTMTGS